jgi:hypothetical protein
MMMRSDGHHLQEKRTRNNIIRRESENIIIPERRRRRRRREVVLKTPVFLKTIAEDLREEEPTTRPYLSASVSRCLLSRDPLSNSLLDLQM